MFEIVNENAKPLAEQVADQVVQLIVEQSLAAGDKLPNEFELAEELHVGRGTVREAVKLLVSRNVLEIRRGKGTFVSEKTGVSNDPLGLQFIQDKRKLAYDLQEVRMLIEPQLASMAAAVATPEDVAQMKGICREIEQMIEKGENYVNKDIELHTCIARSTKNLVVPNLIPIITATIKLFIDLNNRVLWQETIQSHRAIVQYIGEHNAGMASYAMEKHLLDNKRNLEALPPGAFNSEYFTGLIETMP